MMLTLKINTDNAAFEDNLEGELARILATAITKIEHCNTEGKLYDTNGNQVGSFKIGNPQTRKVQRQYDCSI